MFLWRILLVLMVIGFAVIAAPAAMAKKAFACDYSRSIQRLSAGDCYDPEDVRAFERAELRRREYSRELARLEDREYDLRVARARARAVDHHDVQRSSDRRRFLSGRSKTVDRQRSRSVQAY